MKLRVALLFLPLAALAQQGLAACTKEDDAWSIAVFRNMVPFGRPTAGPLERELMASPG
jgi:hypothetical protein